MLRRIIREISVLRQTKDCEFTPELIDIMIKDERGGKTVIFVITEHSHQDLHGYIHKQIETKSFQIGENFINGIVKKTLKAICHLHSQRLIHSNLKASDIIIK